MTEPMQREPEPLTEYDESKYLSTVRNNEVDLYENEYHLIENSLNLPQKFMELDELEKQMVILFIDKDYIEPNSEKKTENDSFISFLAAYPNKSVVKSIYTLGQKVTGYDKEGNEIVESFVMINPESLPLYMKLKKHATMIWNRSNLKEIAKTMRQIMTNDGFKDNELLENQILSDAMSGKRDNFTMANRRLAVEIKGMKKPQGLQMINVFLKGGGKEANEEIVASTGNVVYDLIPDDEEENE